MKSLWLRSAGCCLVGVIFCWQARAAPLEPLLACRAITDPAARLACFDRESGALAQTVPAPPSVSTSPPAAILNRTAPASPAPESRAPATPIAANPAPATSTAAPPAAKALDDFGLAPGAVEARERQAGHQPAPLEQVQGHLTALTKTADGLLVFTLDNGQVWKQLEREGELLANAGDAVRIKRGWLGSYMLSLPSHGACKVTRVR